MVFEASCTFLYYEHAEGATPEQIEARFRAMPDVFNCERRSILLFEADSCEAAIGDAEAWCRNRAEAFKFMGHLNDFRKLGSIKVYRKCIQRVDETGYLPHDNAGMIYEWKCDFPWPVATRETIANGTAYLSGMPRLTKKRK